MNRGFSLVELSIVLVILGLLTGGILAGQSLIKAAELRKVSAQYNDTRTAVATFREKYMALPGDFTKATDFWGTASDCYAPQAGTETCSGNGNGALAYVDFAGEASNVEYEPWHFWKHLANAGLISGTYTGASDSTTCAVSNYCLVGGSNSLRGPISGTGWFAFSTATYNVSTPWIGRATNQRRNVLALVNPRNNTGGYAGTWMGSSIGAEDMWNIDTKIDDGMPYTGMLVDMSGTVSLYSANCATANSNEFGNTPPGTTTVGATYRLGSNAVSATEGCIPFFDM